MPVDVPSVADSEQRLQEAILAFLKAADSGQPLSQQDLLTRYPDLTAELTGFFADQSRLEPVLSPLRGLRHACLPLTAAGPQSIGDYELLDVLAQGGMGVVYKARQKSPNRLVALKMIRASRLATDSDVRRFLNEAETVGNLDHPHIVPLHEVGEEQGQLYFSMKLIEGGSLAEHLSRYQSDPRAAAQLLVTVARAVHHAHQRGVLHRDLKPSNILLDADGQPHVTDFGLAKRVEADGSLTESGAIVGSPSYMAPEQAAGKKGTITTATDVYGLGTILYALLTGRPPFRDDTPLDTLAQVQGREPERPSGVNRRVDRDLETICLKCLDKEPGRRYASAEGLAEDLEHWLEGEPIQARPVGWAERQRRWCQRNPRLAILTATVGMLVLLGLIGLTLATVLIWRAYQSEAKQRQLADEHLREAKEQRRQARQAVDTMYLEVAQKWLDRQPQMGNLQKQFLEKVLRYYEDFAEEEGEDEEARFEKALAYLRVGHLVNFSLARADQAQAPLLKANVLLEELARQFPDKGVYTLKLAEALNVLAFSGVGAEGQQQLERAVSVLDSLVERHPEEAEYRFSLALRLSNLGMVVTSHGELKEGEIHCRRAIALAEDLTRGPSPKPEYHRILGSASSNLAENQQQTGRWVEAVESYRKAIGAYERLSPDTAGLPEYEHHLDAFHWHNLGNFYRDLGTILAHLKRFNEAEAAFVKAVRIHGKLVADFPATGHYWRALFRDYRDKGTMLWAHGQSRQADQSYAQAVQFGDRMAAAFAPDELIDVAKFLVVCPDPKWRNAKRAKEFAGKATEQSPRFAEAWSTLGIAAYRIGDYASAVAALERAMSLKKYECPFDQFFIAMAHWRLGDESQAHRSFEQATASMGKTGWQDEELVRFRAEASALLGISDSPLHRTEKGTTASH
jgi:tetratricopeptide (TPR) repeat protein/tRNA A-37 threonylcarbamoyl transferase component Bud32